jgi:DNA-binding response OmpR family regulator
METRPEIEVVDTSVQSRDDGGYCFVLNQPMNILVVDDDVIQREFSTVYLSEPEVVVETAESALDGLQKLANGHFAAALIDVEMPGMDGIEMVITGREDMASIDRAYAAGATSFMCKPVNWRLLAYQIRFMIRAHGALNQRGGGAHAPD